jgi:hypothetical protein
MVYNAQNHWVCRLCPSSGILNTRKQRFGNWKCFRPQVRGGRHLLCSGFLMIQIEQVSPFRLPKDGNKFSFRNVQV